MNPKPLSTRSVRIVPVMYTSSILVSCLPTRLRATPRFAAAAAAGIRGLRPRFVDRQTAAAELIFVQLCDRLLRLIVGAHLDEGKPARAPGGHVAHDFHRFHAAGAGEQFLELRFSGFIREISDIQLSTHDLTPLPRNATTSTAPRRRTGVHGVAGDAPWCGISSRS